MQVGDASLTARDLCARGANRILIISGALVLAVDWICRRSNFNVRGFLDRPGGVMADDELATNGHRPRPGVALIAVGLLIVAGCIHTAAAGVVSLVRGAGLEQTIGLLILTLVTAIGVAQYAAIGRRSETAAWAMARTCWALAAVHLLLAIYAAVLLKFGDAMFVSIFTVFLLEGANLNRRWAERLRRENQEENSVETPFQLSLREVLGAMAVAGIVAALAANQMQSLTGR